MYKIAITGKANSGKNTLARMIVKQLRINNKKFMVAKYLAFADPIKEMIRAMYPTLPKKFLYGSSKYRSEIIPDAFKNGNPLTIRQLLIDLGTEMGRAYNPTIWLDNFDYRFKQVNYYPIVLVTDVRFRNEFEHLAKQGFYQIKLYRDIDKPSVAPSFNLNNHISETSQDMIRDEEYNYVLRNNSTLRNMRDEVNINIIPRIPNIK